MTWSALSLMPPPSPPVLSSGPDSSAAPTGRLIAWVCWLMIFALAGTLLALSALHEKRIASPANAQAPSPTFEMTGRLLVVQADKTATLSGDEKKTAEKILNTLVDSADQSAKTPAERLAMVPLIYEARGRAPAVQRLDQEIPSLSQTPSLNSDALIIRQIYSARSTAITAVDREKLAKDLGWFGELAITQGAEPANPQRAELLARAGKTQADLLWVATAFLLGGGLGLLLFVIAIVLLAVGSIHPTFARLSPGGPPRLLIVFTIWLYGFFGISLILAKLAVDLPDVVHEMIAFAWTAVVITAPGIRGATWARWRSMLGLHAGRGIIVEMVCGITGYLAGLPLLAVGVLITLMLMKATNSSATHPIARQLTEKITISKVAGLFLMASVMAPILEEVTFRGLLYGHLRRKWNPFISATMVALIFAMVHPQGWVAIPALGTIAFVLAMLREWRGSLIASMTAHAFSNGLVLLLGLTLLH